MAITNKYISAAPNNQNVIDIFKGNWLCEFPNYLNLESESGTARAFEDTRVEWAEKNLGSFTNCNVLELGPLEAAHSYMLQNKNVNNVLSIESNTYAFLKCLCVKEMLKLDRVDFKLGDFFTFLEHDTSKYDVIFASGVLYHMTKPVELLKLISKVTDKLFIWTHYFDKEIISKRLDYTEKFAPIMVETFEGLTYEYATQSYNEWLGSENFCGGSQSVSRWLTRDSIIRALSQFGFIDMQIGFDEPEHPNGPSLAICAQKNG